MFFDGWEGVLPVLLTGVLAAVALLANSIPVLIGSMVSAPAFPRWPWCPARAGDRGRLGARPLARVDGAVIATTTAIGLLVFGDLVQPPAIPTALTFAFFVPEFRLVGLFLLAALVATQRLVSWRLQRISPEWAPR